MPPELHSSAFGTLLALMEAVAVTGLLLARRGVSRIFTANVLLFCMGSQLFYIPCFVPESMKTINAASKKGCSPTEAFTALSKQRATLLLMACAVCRWYLF